MNEALMWRKLLRDLVRRMSSAEKRQFYANIGVTRTTIQCWHSGTDSPKVANLERLLTVLSGEQRDQFLALLQNDPKV